MNRRFYTLCAAAVAAASALSVIPLAAQNSPPPETRPVETPHAPRAQQPHNLDFLFDALKVAPDDTSAKAIKDRIWALWLASGGDTTDLLMTRVRSAIEAKDLDLAIKLLDAIIDFKPDYVEGWDRRATVFYMKKEYGRALSDIAQVLVREPRHFGALFGLGLILQEFGEEKRALDIYRRALAIDPHSQRIPELVKTLTEKIEGRDI
jgi:tetratricopeptide (TPR) repeat protein